MPCVALFWSDAVDVNLLTVEAQLIYLWILLERFDTAAAAAEIYLMVGSQKIECNKYTPPSLTLKVNYFLCSTCKFKLNKKFLSEFNNLKPHILQIQIKINSILQFNVQ